jgi:hypothetical protein
MATSVSDEYDEITKRFDPTYPTLVGGLERDRHRGHYACVATAKYHHRKKDSIFFSRNGKVLSLIDKGRILCRTVLHGYGC